MAAVLTCENLAVERGGRVLVTDFSCELPPGTRAGIVGDNGAGKTSLCRTLAQLNRPYDGHFSIAGHEARGVTAAAARALTALVPHEPLMWADLDVATNLQIAARLSGHDPGVSTGAIERWGLSDVAGQAAGTLSRGWRQRYSLARADRPGVRLWILDEPTTGLDADGRAGLEAAIDRWTADAVVLIASHERDWLAGIVDETWELGST